MTDNNKISLDILNFEHLSQVSYRIAKVVHERDHYVCQFCEFRSVKYQQILNLDGNWRDIDAIITACIFCQQCFSLDAVVDMSSGVLIAFPDIKQAELNRLAIEIYVARLSQDQNRAKKARESLNYLMSASEAANTQLELGTKSIREMAQKLKDHKTGLEISPVIEEKLPGIRLFPLDCRTIREGELEFNQFPLILAYWRSPSGPFALSDSNLFRRLDRFAENYL